MTDTTYVRGAVPEDIEYLAPRLREIDLQEIEASGCYPTATSALREGLEQSELCFTALSPDTGLPVAMFGLVLAPGMPLNSVWLLGTDEVKRHSNKFLLRSRAWVDAFALYGDMGNVVLATNDIHIRWLVWCGFEHFGSILGPNREARLLYVKRGDA